MYDVVLYEVFDEEERLLKEFMPSDVRAKYFSGTIQEEAKKEPAASLISIRTQSVIPEGWASDVQGILTRSTGYDHLLKYKKKTKTKALCGYLPNYCSRAVAEQAVLMMAALLRKLPLQMKNMKQFNRNCMTGQECQKRNLLVVGVGRIGSEVVDIALGLGMNVRGVDISPKKEGIEYVSLEEGIAWAHSVICAVPLTDLTRGLLNYSLFKKASSQIVFVNIARGEISPLKDLKRLLEEEVVAGLGMDVYEEEEELAELLRTKKDLKSPGVLLFKELQQKENVLFTPHNAFNTCEALKRKAQQTTSAIIMFHQRKTFPDLIPEEGSF